MLRGGATGRWRALGASVGARGFAKGKKGALPFELGAGHNIRLRENFEPPASDSDSDGQYFAAGFSEDLPPDPRGRGGVQFGDCLDEVPDDDNEDEDDEDDRSHPVEDTGFEFRDYGELREPMEPDSDEVSMSAEEKDMLKLPDQHKKAKKKFPYVQRDFTKCRGCGIRLQSDEPVQLGYVPPPNVKRSRKKKRICQRCYYLRFHNKEPPHLERNVELKYETGLSAESVSAYLSEVLPTKSCVILHMVDLSDMSPDSFIPNLTKVAGTNPIIFIGTKLDLLPGDWRIHRLKLWLQKYAKKFCGLTQLPLTHVHIVSARSGQNVKATMRNVDVFRKDRDLYVIGPVNSGKSSFINSALLHVGIGGVKYDKKYGLTTSNLPGTTLDAISMPLKSGGHLHDTPGFQVPNILPSLVTGERKIMISRKSIRPKIVYMREGKSILLGGCARLDYLRGPPMYFAIFGSSLLPHHFTSIEGAERLINGKLGSYLSPPALLESGQLEKELDASSKYTTKLYKYLPTKPKKSQPKEDEEVEADEGYDSGDVVEVDDEHTVESTLTDRVLLLNQQRPFPLPLNFSEEQFELNYGGEDFDSAFADFVFPGIGWISATGKAEENLIFRASSFSKPYIRDPIMPLEANRDKRKARGYKRHGKLANYQYSVEEHLPYSKE